MAKGRVLWAQIKDAFAGGSAAPESTRAVLPYCQRRRLRLPTQQITVESGCAGAPRVEPRKPVGGRDPVVALARLGKVGDQIAGQALLGVVIGELVSVETRESFGRAEPEKAVRVLNDAENVVPRQPIGRGVGLDGQPLRGNERSHQKQRS